MKNQTKNMKKNKGFSLVELIVVIAIMAVLVGILAPQFIKYVDKSRRSTDIKNVQEYVSAIEVYASDNTGWVGGTITLTTAADTTKITGTDQSLSAALTNAGLSVSTLSSASWGTITITVVNTDDSPVYTVTNTSSTKYNFSNLAGFTSN